MVIRTSHKKREPVLDFKLNRSRDLIVFFSFWVLRGSIWS